MAASLDLKSKIKHIEEFDAWVGRILKDNEKEASLRVAVMGDVAESVAQKIVTKNPTLAVIAGEGIVQEKNEAFNEKACGQSPLIEKGNEFLRSFLS